VHPDSRPRVFGASLTPAGTRFTVWSGAAERIWLSLFDERGEREIERLEMTIESDSAYALTVHGVGVGARYGFRADGPYDPGKGLWFDPDKLLMDPYAVAIDRPYAYDPRLAMPRDAGIDTAALMPKAVVTKLPAPVRPGKPIFRPGGLIYELQVKAFTMRHPEVPAADRGTLRGLMHPAIIEHLQQLGVSAIELMPVTAWIDERHLGPLGLTNAWGYNPVSFMALDPRLAPNGIQDLRDVVAAYRLAGIGVILDLVFNHTGESDEEGPTLSLRGLDNRTYYRHAAGGRLVNDTGTGNTLACDRPAVRDLVLDSLRHFVLKTGVDGFRFDLAPVMGRDEEGFDPNAALLKAMGSDPVLADRILIAEPWDIGANGYQLGKFPKPFLEWNDVFRDDVRRFWRGDRGMVGGLATRLAGSSDVFGASPATRGVNFLAAHDGFTLADLVAYERKHNEDNGEQNRDGHNDNLSWNCGMEGASLDQAIHAQRDRDIRGLLATLFFSRGTIMLTAGDEFGRTQHGNNNAYAQDNPDFWLDWDGRNRDLEAYAFALAGLRRDTPALADCAWLTGTAKRKGGLPDVEWLTEAGRPLTVADWQDPARRRLTMMLATKDGGRVALIINADRRGSVFSLPERDGYAWIAAGPTNLADSTRRIIGGRSCASFLEKKS